MKDVLILTASTGEGHNQAAKSLEKKYQEKGYRTHKLDFVKESNKITNLFIGKGYEFITHFFPNLYGKFYHKFDKAKFNHLVQYSLLTARRRVAKSIDRVQPDVIIATHPFAVGIVSSLKTTHQIDCKFISVVTDFSAHYAYISPDVDAYITGSEYTKQTLIDRHIPENKIYTFGIPVKESFHKETGFRSSSRHSDNPFKVLIMGGSMGSKDIEKVLSKMAEKTSGYEMTVVCGRNKSLYEDIVKKYSAMIKQGNLVVLGFSDKIPELMTSCDVIITKPGGLTTSESLNLKIPMIIPFAIPGQEQENIDFLVKSGVAIHVSNINQLPWELERLQENAQMYEKMIANMNEITKNYSTDKIIELSDRLILQNIDPVAAKNLSSQSTTRYTM